MKEKITPEQVVGACQILIKRCLQDKQDNLNIEYEISDKLKVKCEFTVEVEKL